MVDLERSGTSLPPAGSGSAIPQRSHDYAVSHLSQQSLEIIE